MILSDLEAQKNRAESKQSAQISTSWSDWRRFKSSSWGEKHLLEMKIIKFLLSMENLKESHVLDIHRAFQKCYTLKSFKWLLVEYKFHSPVSHKVLGAQSKQ